MREGNLPAMQKLLHWVQNIMRQANPVDELSRFLLKAGAVIGIIGILFGSSLILWMGFALVLWMYVRTFSKDRQKNYQQNRKFQSYKNRFMKRFSKQSNVVQLKKARMQQRKTHRFYKCPNCKQQVRIPKGRGKVSITCPSCRTKFIKKS